ncbi:hypothetical protein [Streptomyces iconiensis]|uniref:Secreted protein n=1 Tax=Streptomyces iconiensis TaxID=1384038 RepID=A0ABT6ZT24_9ACTN|nr:hypothetical protein [Streptomyces iconiensis]MDJ1132215.1 hypothetical protein [Streptomyces iconiensis]
MTQLPHTRTRTVHWLATTAALAAVLGASALLQPADATANPAESTARASGAPDPGAAHYPMDCGGASARTDVLDKGTADFDGDGLAETVAVVRCKAEGGTPPSAVFVLAHPAHKGAPPRIVATLVRQKERMSVKDFTTGAGTVSATLLGYSSPDVPRCCPDKQRKVKWEWKNGKFALTPAPVAGSVSV